MKNLLTLICLFVITISNAQYTDSTGNYSSTNPYNLNVVYFVPTDMPLHTRYKERLSAILKSAKALIKKNMDAKGFPNSSMGLFTDANGLVKINTIKGKFDLKKYNYKDGVALIEAEVNQYYIANPHEKASEHILIITSVKLDETHSPDVPFFGTGRLCYALDYDQMDEKYFKDKGQGFWGDQVIAWIGGLVHEMTHGLNVDHDASSVSEQAKLGESLMSGGNSTYGVEPTHVTSATCAILNSSQIFQKEPVEDLYAESNTFLKNVIVKSINGSTVQLSGKIESNLTVDYTIGFLDPEGGEDYNQVGWVQKPVNNYFSISLPLNEIPLKDGKCDVKLTITYTNGTIDSYPVNVPIEIKAGKTNVFYTKESIHVGFEE